MNDRPLIRDIPAIRDLLQQVEALKILKGLFTLSRPILKILHIDISNIEESFAQVEELAGKAKNMALVLDAFNDFFAERGWIMYDSINFKGIRSRPP